MKFTVCVLFLALAAQAHAATITVQSMTATGDAASVLDNDFLRLANGINGATGNDTVVLQGTFDFTEPNAAAAWALGVDGVAGPTAANDDFELRVRTDLHGVTLTAAVFGDAKIVGPQDLPAINSESFLVFAEGANRNWTVSKLQIEGFDLSIGFFYSAAGGSNAFDGTVVEDNEIRIPKDLNATEAPADPTQNIGLHFAFGQNQRIEHNTFIMDQTGVNDGANTSSGVAMQSNTSGGGVYDGLLITRNTVRVTGVAAASPASILGIWENSHGHTSNIVVSNNSVIVEEPGANHVRGFQVTSHSSATTQVSYTNNTITGADVGYQWIAGSDFSTTLPIVVTGLRCNATATCLLIRSNGQARVQDSEIVGGGVGMDIVTGSALARSTLFEGQTVASVRTAGAATLDAGAAGSSGLNRFATLPSGAFAIDNGSSAAQSALANFFGTTDNDAVELLINHFPDNGQGLVTFAALAAPTAADLEGAKQALVSIVLGSPDIDRIEILSLPTYGTLQDGSTALSPGAILPTNNVTLAYTRTASDADAFTYRVRLGAGISVPYTVSLTNQAPSLTGTASNVQVGATFAFAPTAVDSNGDTLTFSATGLPVWATLNPATGVISGTAGDAGAVTLTLTASDGALSTPLTVTFAVTALPTGTTGIVAGSGDEEEVMVAAPIVEEETPSEEQLVRGRGCGCGATTTAFDVWVLLLAALFVMRMRLLSARA